MDKGLINAEKRFIKIKEGKNKKSNKYSNIRLVLFLLAVISLILYIKITGTIFLILLSIFIVLFIVLVILHRRVDNEINEIICYLSIIEKYKNRTNDDWKSDGFTYNESTTNFVGDLDIIGKNSLMQFLDFTASLGGKRRLIETLTLKNVNKKRILENQGAISELKENIDFVLSFLEKMYNIENIENIDFKELFLLFDKKLGNKKKHFICSLVITVLTYFSLILALVKVLSPAIFVILFFLQLAISYIYSIHFGEEFEDIEKCSRIFSKLSDVFLFVNNSEFKNEKNKRLKNEIGNSTSILKSFNFIAELNMFRGNFLTNILLNVFFSLNFWLLYRYSVVLSRETNDFKKGIIALEEFEELISLTTICFVRKDICLPSINDSLRLEISMMKHPLIDEKKCIANDFECEKDINIITGSNMSGKTSFMRTIGVNLILAYSGTYVNASNFECPIMNIFTSINVKDDIANGISTFYGELKRIKDILEYSSKHDNNIIVFIDEIFKGTNYNDRILGAKETLKRLSDLNAIVFLTTHDFELCEIKSKVINNYHFSETYKDDKISFDYKIKKGQCKTTNAKYLMEQMGIVEK